MPNLVLPSLVTPLLAEQAPAPGAGGGGMQMIIILLLMVGMFFLMTSSQRKKQKEHQKLINSVATGDEVLTSGGIYGIVTNVKQDRLVLRVGEGTKLEIARSFITSVEKKTGAE